MSRFGFVSRIQALDPVAHDADSIGGDDALRMELYTLNVRVLLVATCHDRAVLGPCSHLEALRAVLTFDHKTVVAGSLEWAAQTWMVGGDRVRWRKFAMEDLL